LRDVKIDLRVVFDASAAIYVIGALIFSSIKPSAAQPPPLADGAAARGV